LARNLLTVMGIKNSPKAKLRDGDGLCLHQKGAGRYWFFQYTRQGKRREMGLGPYGSGTGQVSLAAARVKADEIRDILGRDGDPFVEMVGRKVHAPVVTFGTVIDEYIAIKKVQWRGRSSEARWRRTAEVYAKDIRKLSIATVSTDDVVKVLKPIWTEMAETAAKVREHIKLVLDHAKARGLRTGENPAEWRGHLDQILPKRDALAKTNHAAMPYTDVPAFMKELRELDGTPARALEFLILTAARSGEARGAAWSEIDLDTKVWTIPAKRMKAGKEHRVPLTDRAVEIVAELKAKAVGEHVFTGRVSGRQMADPMLASVLTALDAKDCTVHGFRSAFRDWCSEATEFQSEIAEAALAHSVGTSVVKAYRRGDALERRRAMMTAWAEFCANSGPK